MEKQQISKQSAITLFIIFLLGWFLHGVFIKPDTADCRELVKVDEKVFEAWNVDDVAKSAEMLIEATKERNEIIKKLNY